jgi:hypothetical protein
MGTGLAKWRGKCVAVPPLQERWCHVCIAYVLVISYGCVDNRCLRIAVSVYRIDRGGIWDRPIPQTKVSGPCSTTAKSEHMPQPAYNNSCWSQVVRCSQMPFVFSLVRRFLFLSRGSPICSALFLKLHLKITNFFICIIHAQTLLHIKHYGNESYLKCSYGNFSYTGESPHATPNANKDGWRRGKKLPHRHSHHLSQYSAPHYNMQIRDMCSV